MTAQVMDIGKICCLHPMLGFLQKAINVNVQRGIFWCQEPFETTSGFTELQQFAEHFHHFDFTTLN